jgi:iron complex transport system substrate-binding protein
MMIDILILLIGFFALKMVKLSKIVIAELVMSNIQHQCIRDSIQNCQAVFRSAVISLLIILCCTACGIQKRQPDAAQPDPDVPTHTVRHAFGQSEIPLNPQRVVMLFPGIDFDNLLALGMTPVGVATYTADRLYILPPYLDDQTAGIETVGTMTQPSLERLALLDPDLIIMLSFSREAYPRLTQIAPTVVLEATERSLPKRLRKLAEFVNREEEAEEIIEELEQLIKQFQDDMGERLDEVEVSVLRVRSDGIFGYVKSSPTGIALEELGIKRPPAQDVFRLLGTRIDISMERLDQADGDIIFIWGALKGDAEARERLFANPLWQRLNAVQAGHVYVVPEDYWAFPGVQGFRLIVEDLYTYLVEQHPEKSPSPNNPGE